MSRVRDLVTQADPNFDATLERYVRNSITGQETMDASWSASIAGPVQIGQTTTDVVTPDYHSRSAAGEIINNPFSSHKWDFDGPHVTEVEILRESNYPRVVQGRAYDAMTNYTGVQVYLGPSVYTLASKPPGTAELFESMKTQAVTSAHASINEAEMQALATIAESGKTMAFFYYTLQKAVKIFRAVRKLDIAATKREFRPKELEDMYMSYRYALRPLMYDVNDLTAALTKERASDVRRTSRGWAKDSATGSEQLNMVSLVDGTMCDYMLEWNYEVSARAGVLCDVTIDAATQFGVTDFIETAWELLPFSFIADWFCNTGETLAAWTPNMRSEQLSSWVTMKENLSCSSFAGEVTDLWVPDQYTTINEVVVQPGWYRGLESLQQRIVDPQLSVFPSADMRLDGLKILDLSIILRKLFQLRYL